VKIGRHELKCFINHRDYYEMLAWLEPHVTPDEMVPQDCREYTVRSIYYDSEDLDFYFEKLDGVKVRKKLRIRGYGESSHSPQVFLEIKRKYGNLVSKERTRMEFRCVEPILDSSRPKEVLPSAGLRDLNVIGKFLHALRTRSLRPTVLVAYEREALVGREDRRLRVTFDRDVRCAFRPTLNHLFHVSDWLSVVPHNIILELKFNGPMPVWLRRMVWRFKLRMEPISKYCRSVEACCGGDWQDALRLLKCHDGESNAV
jgi:hypothetical protein